MSDDKCNGPAVMPLTERLRSIPPDVRLIWTDTDGLKATHYVPIGLLAQDAADALDAALAALEGVKKEQSRVARLILRVRDLIAANDLAEAYHQLYAIADPTSTSLTPWAALAECAAALPADGGGEL